MPTKKLGYRINEDLFEKLKSVEDPCKLIENLLSIYFNSDTYDIENKLKDNIKIILAEEKIKNSR